LTEVERPAIIVVRAGLWDVQMAARGNQGAWMLGDAAVVRGTQPRLDGSITTRARQQPEDPWDWWRLRPGLEVVGPPSWVRTARPSLRA